RLTNAPRKPELVIFGLDYWWFQAPVPVEQQSKTRVARFIDYGRYRQLREGRYQVQEWTDFTLDQVQLFQKAWRDPRLYAALRAPPMEPVTNRLTWSVPARLLGDGYRNDGSYRYTSRLRHFAEQGVSDGGASADWTKDSETFTGNYLNEAGFDDLREFIAE